ncbi:MAG TPA: phosphotriesterase, partial [Thermoleophilia bacterium]|nr:phosphotriesterase [Thermoleophilia bacterium]
MIDPAEHTGKVVTVRGPIEPADLGLCLPHEHLLCRLDLGFDWPDEGTDPGAAAFAAAPITLDNLERVHREPDGNRSNQRLDDAVDEVLEELELFRTLGGGGVVDQTTADFGRDLSGLLSLSRTTGVHVVAGSGRYTADFQPTGTTDSTVDELAAEIVADLLADRLAGGIPCGVIGEVGASSPHILPAELRSLRAAALAQLRTGAPVSIHAQAPDHTGLEALLILKEYGVDPGRVAICHLDSGIDLDYQREIAREGAWLSYDWFGWNVPGGGGAGELPHSDRERVAAVAELVGEGLGDQLLLSHDVA